MQFEKIITSIQKSPLRQTPTDKIIYFPQNSQRILNSNSSSKIRLKSRDKKVNPLQIQFFNMNIPGSTKHIQSLRFVDVMSQYLERKSNENHLSFMSFDMSTDQHPKSIPRPSSANRYSKHLKIELKTSYEKYFEINGRVDKPTPYNRSYTPTEFNHIPRPKSSTKKLVKRRQKENLPELSTPREKYKKLVQNASFSLEHEPLKGW